MFKKSVLACSSLVLAFPAFAHRQTLITCVSPALGAPTINVIAEHNAGAPTQYIIAETPLHPDAPTTELAMQNVQDVNYGGTRIITANHGRSGYAHVYVNESGLSLLDIHVFGQMLLEAPNAYLCSQGR